MHALSRAARRGFDGRRNCPLPLAHATRWDATKVEGSLADHDGKVTFLKGGRPLAVATIFRDRDSLTAEAEMEQRVTKG
jgi:hypothetical protein